jgi:hypothetical protein
MIFKKVIIVILALIIYYVGFATVIRNFIWPYVDDLYIQALIIAAWSTLLVVAVQKTWKAVCYNKQKNN